MQAADCDQTQKEQEREKLAADVAEFLRKGGRIERLEVQRRTETDASERLSKNAAAD